MPKRIFISHRNVEPDLALARELHDGLEHRRHRVFLDASDLRLGDEWPAVIQRELERADALILLLSESVATSPDMVARELSIVHKLKQRRGKPAILPILLGGDVFDQLPYDLAAKIERVQYETWGGAGDSARILGVVAEVLGEAAPPAGPGPDGPPLTGAERQEIRAASNLPALALRSSALLRAGRLSAAEVAGERLIELAAEKGDDRFRAAGLMLLGDVYKAQGHEARALVQWRRGRPIFERLGRRRELAEIDRRLR